MLFAWWSKPWRASGQPFLIKRSGMLIGHRLAVQNTAKAQIHGDDNSRLEVQKRVGANQLQRNNTCTKMMSFMFVYVCTHMRMSTHLKR